MGWVDHKAETLRAMGRRKSNALAVWLTVAAVKEAERLFPNRAGTVLPASVRRAFPGVLRSADTGCFLSLDSDAASSVPAFRPTFESRIFRASASYSITGLITSPVVGVQKNQRMTRSRGIGCSAGGHLSPDVPAPPARQFPCEASLKGLRARTRLECVESVYWQSSRAADRAWGMRPPRSLANALDT